MKRIHILLFSILFSSQFISAQNFSTFLNKGDSCNEKRAFSQAISFYKQALESKPERIITSENEVEIFYNLGNAYTDIAEYQTALEFYFKYIDKDVVKNNNALLSNAYNKIGVNYNYLKQEDQALKFYNKCIETASDDTIRIAGAYNNMANIYQNKKQFEIATDYYKKALFFFNKKKHYEGQIAVNMNIGIIELITNKIETALSYFKHAEELASEQHDTLNLIAVYINLGDFYTTVKDYDEAQRHLEWALKYANKVNSRMLITESYKSLVNLYKTKKDYQNAFNYLELFKANSDSIFYQNSNQEYAELEAKFSIREKQKENELLKKEQEFTESQIESQEKYIWMLLGLVLVAIVFMVLFYFQRKSLSKSKYILEAQNKEIKKSQKQMKDLNYQYEKLIEKYEGDNLIKPNLDLNSDS